MNLSAPPKIRIRDLGLRYVRPNEEQASAAALAGLSLEVGAGQFVAIVGPSGCGKSTLLKVISGLLRPTRGAVEIDGEIVTGVPKGVGFLFQSDALLPWRSARQNVQLGGVLAGLARAAANDLAKTLLDDLGLGQALDKYPAELSGGMRKRVALARTLAYNPSVYLLDEPFSALDAQTRVQVANRFLDVFQRLAQSVILVTHDIEEAIVMADRVLVLTASPGRVAAEFDVSLPRPRDYYRSKFEPAFRPLQQTIWDVLRQQIDDIAS